jgi:asparaginyl-tRNA synthetase
MDLAEALVRDLTETVMSECAEDLALFARFVDKTLMDRLKQVSASSFRRLPYREAVSILQAAKQSFQFPVEFGSDLQSEHERYLTEQHFGGPVILYDYPKSIKPFYMRLNDDGETVSAMDVLVPGIGEIIGGSQREERFAVLEARMQEAGMNPEDYWWYLDVRRYGTAPHSGFGLGFERMLMLLTGASNIRDVIPFPRTPGSIEF